MKKNIYLIIGVIVLLAIGWFIYFGVGKTQESQSVSEQPTNAVAPNLGGETYTNTALDVSVSYPNGYAVENITKPNSNKLLFVQFTPPSEKSTESVRLIVFPLNKRTSLEDWVSAFTTQSNTANLPATSSSYLIDQVNDLEYQTIDGKSAATFTQGKPGTEDSEYVTLFMGPRYVVYLGQQASKVNNDYKTMLSSLRF